MSLPTERGVVQSGDTTRSVMRLVEVIQQESAMLIAISTMGDQNT
jgi:hypothetical protein